jgi:hypothetical protein
LNSYFTFRFSSIFKQESVANSQKWKNPQHQRVAGLQTYIVAILSILTHAEFYEPPPILIEQEYDVETSFSPFFPVYLEKVAELIVSLGWRFVS